MLSADLFELPASHLLDAVVIATVVDGKVVYDRDTDTPPTSDGHRARPSDRAYASPYGNGPSARAVCT